MCLLHTLKQPRSLRCFNYVADLREGYRQMRGVGCVSKFFDIKSTACLIGACSSRPPVFKAAHASRPTRECAPAPFWRAANRSPASDRDNRVDDFASRPRYEGGMDAQNDIPTRTARLTPGCWRIQLDAPIDPWREAQIAIASADGQGAAQGLTLAPTCDVLVVARQDVDVQQVPSGEGAGAFVVTSVGWAAFSAAFAGAFVQSVTGSPRRTLHSMRAWATRKYWALPLPRNAAAPTPTPPPTRDRPPPAPVGTTVSVIIPTRDTPDLLAACLDGLKRSSPAPDEIILVDHCTEDLRAQALIDTARRQGARVVRDDGTFNFSRLINRGAEIATGQVLVLLNNDVTPLTPGWLSVLTDWAMQPDVGVVGAELRYPSGPIQHAGIVKVASGLEHVCLNWPASRRGPDRILDRPRNVLAVTGACLATQRAVFDRLGGLDEAYPSDFNDVDYALRAREAGFATVWTPHARLTHHESVTRKTASDKALRARLERYAALTARHPILTGFDPHFSPLFDQAPPSFKPRVWRP